jgi:hypothetical protein
LELRYLVDFAHVKEFGRDSEARFRTFLTYAGAAMKTILPTFARLAGGLLFLFFAAMVVGEGPPNPLRLTARENLYAVGMLLLYGGLAVAWFRADWGGAMTVGGWVYLALLSWELPLDWPLAAPGIVGAVHAVCAWAGWVKVRRPSLVVCVLLAGFVGLCANEMFGNPPLMASGERPLAELAGDWGDGEARLRIDATGVVSGTVGADSIGTARLEPNRSWFGRLLGWRTDYRIRGRLVSGEPINVLLNGGSGGLAGTVEVGGRRGHFRVRLQRPPGEK